MDTNRIKQIAANAGNNLVAFAKLERIIAAICILIPAFLVWGDYGRIRGSISDYINMDNRHIFGLLLAIAAMLFIVNGAVYINTVGIKHHKKPGRWYNIILGIALMGVPLFPYDNPTVTWLHYFCAIVFFAGSAVVIYAFHDPKNRRISRIIAVLTLISFVIYLINANIFHVPLFGWMTLFWAECISLAVIGVHYILESLGELT